MATTHKLLITSVTTHEPVRWKGQEVYKYFPRLRSFLASKLGEEYANFFARPQVRRGAKGKPEIIWLSDNLSSSYFEGAAAVGKKGAGEIEQVFREKITEWEAGTEEDGDWAKLLELCLDNCDGAKIFSDGETDVIAGWALQPLRQITGSPLGRMIPTASPPSVAIPAPSSPPEAPVDTSSTSSELDTESFDSAFESAENSTPSENQPHSVEEQPVFESSDGESTVPEKKRNSLFRFWWLLPIVLLIIALAWWLSQPPVPGLLPDNPNVLIPVDSSDVGLAPDSNAVVVTNRINVLLKAPNQDMEGFARDFKEIYPGKEYRVIYYDTMLARLQLIVPKTERIQIMDGLADKLPDFDMLIFPESMYENQAIPSDPGFSNPGASWYFRMIDAPSAWDISYGSDRVIVGIIDDGCDLNHPEFKNRIVRPYNALSRNSGVYGGPRHQHGTHVAGTAVAARNNKEGLAGIAPDCLLMPIQVADRGGRLPSTAIVDGVLYAINNGAKVINLSLGKQFGPFLKLRPRAYQERMIREAFLAEASFWNEIINIAEENGVTVVFAAGNDAVLAGIDPMQRSSKSIKVSAVAQNGMRASFSNYGDYSTISAPGVEIYSSVPGSTYKQMQGTSMAAPIVTGAVALAQSVNPDLTPSEIRELLVRTGLRRDPTIGPILQLGAFIQAANSAAGNTNPPPTQNDECEDINRQIEELERQIEELKQSCGDYSSNPDTMKMTPAPDDLDFTIGRWKSTTPLTNAQTGEQLTFFFRFLPDGTGELTMVEASGIQCTSDLQLRRNNRDLKIRQPAGAQCRGVNRSYSPYDFSCSPDATGTVICKGVNQNNQNNQLEFKLVRVN